MSDEIAPPPGAPPPNAPPPFAPPPNAPPPFAPPGSPHFAPPPNPPPGMAPPTPQAFVAELPARRRHPVLGASLWTFGAVLWAYLVMGEWVLQFDLPEALGALVVIAATGIAWLSAVRDLTAPADRWRRLIALGGGLALFLTTLLFVTLLFGTTRRSVVGAITVLLWFFSASVYIAGRYVTARPPVARTRLRTAATVVLWLVAGLGTFVSVASTLSHA